MSRESVEFLLGLLDRVSISGSDPDIVEAAQRIAKARRELSASVEG